MAENTFLEQVKKSIIKFAKKEIEEKDYVIEEGLNGVYHFRKWKSGIYEVFGEWIGNSTNTKTVGGFALYTVSLDYSALTPFKELYTSSFQTRVGNGQSWCSYPSIGYDKSIISIISDTPGNNSIRVYFSISGTWK